MQSAMAHAVDEVARVDGRAASTSTTEAQVPLDDDRPLPADPLHAHAGHASRSRVPGSASSSASSGRAASSDLIIDISLFRPGPVKSDMITPFLTARHGWQRAGVPPPQPRSRRWRRPRASSSSTSRCCTIVAETTGVTLAQADEVRRSTGHPAGPDRTSRRGGDRRRRPGATRRRTVDRIWEVLKAFASFGFCKAHAAAFALPTYPLGVAQGPPPGGLPGRRAHPRPGHVPQAADPRRRPQLRHPDARPRRQRLGRDLPGRAGRRAGCRADPDVDPDAVAPTPDAGRCLTRRQPYGIRLSLADVKGISEAEVRADRRRPALRRPRRLLEPRPGQPPGGRAARARRGHSTRLLRHGPGPAAVSGGVAGSPGATCCCTSPSSTGAGAMRVRRGAAPAQPPTARHAPRIAPSREATGGERATCASGRRRSPRRPARSCRPPGSPPSSPSTSATARGSPWPAPGCPR